MSSPFFFVPSLKSTSKRSFIDVGAGGDCGFRALAAGIIDNSLSAPNINEHVVSRMLQEHDKYYSVKNDNSSKIPCERLKKMVANPQLMAETIGKFAWILRQIAAAEWDKDPVTYRGAFTKENEKTSPTAMRQLGNWIDENAIAAIASALDVPITVSVASKAKDLPAKYQYNHQAKASNILVQLKDKHYTAGIKNTKYFINLAKPEIDNILPPNHRLTDDNEFDMADILQRIQKDNERLADDFQQNIVRFTAMLESKELNKDDLLAIYIAGMHDSDYLQGRVKYVGIEHGNHDFFQAALDNVNRSSLQPTNSANNNYDQQITQELVHAIARAISIGQLDEDVIDNHLDGRINRLYS